MQEIVDRFIEQNEVTFIMQAVNGDGEVLLQETSSMSFDDVSGHSWRLDQAFNKMAVESEEGRDDAYIDAEINNEQDARDY